MKDENLYYSHCWLSYHAPVICHPVESYCVYFVTDSEYYSEFLKYVG